MFSGLGRDGLEGRVVDFGRTSFYVNELYPDNSADIIDFAASKYVKDKGSVNDSGVISTLDKILEVGLYCAPGKITTISGDNQNTAGNNTTTLSGAAPNQPPARTNRREVLFRYYHFIYSIYPTPLANSEYPEVTRFIELTNVIIPYTARTSVDATAAKTFKTLGVTITCGLNKKVMDYFAKLITEWEQPSYGCPIMQPEEGATYQPGEKSQTVMNAFLPGITDEYRAAVRRGEIDPEEKMCQTIDFDEFYWMQCKFSLDKTDKVTIVDDNDKVVELGSLIERYTRTYDHDPLGMSMVCNAKIEIKTSYGLRDDPKNTLNTSLVYPQGGKAIGLTTPTIKVKIIGMNMVDWVGWSHPNTRVSGGSTPRMAVVRSMRNAAKFSTRGTSSAAQVVGLGGAFAQQMDAARRMAQGTSSGPYTGGQSAGPFPRRGPQTSFTNTNQFQTHTGGNQRFPSSQPHQQQQQNQQYQPPQSQTQPGQSVGMRFGTGGLQALPPFEPPAATNASSGAQQGYDQQHQQQPHHPQQPVQQPPQHQPAQPSQHQPMQPGRPQAPGHVSPQVTQRAPEHNRNDVVQPSDHQAAGPPNLASPVRSEHVVDTPRSSASSGYDNVSVNSNNGANEGGEQLGQSYMGSADDEENLLEGLELDQ